MTDTNPERKGHSMQRGETYRTATGTTGRYVGTSPMGVVWVEWEGDAAAYARMCAAFDQLHGSREPHTDDAPGDEEPACPACEDSGYIKLIGEPFGDMGLRCEECNAPELL